MQGEGDLEIGWLYYGARMYDAEIGRFTGVDPLAEKFAAWTSYHYVHNNPISLTDPFGLSADSTRIYNLEGIYQGTINDSYQNEEHFMSDKMAQTALSSNVSTGDIAGWVRNNSEYYVGQQTRNELQAVEAASAIDGAERMFLMTYTENCRELHVSDVTYLASSRDANGITPPYAGRLQDVGSKIGILVGYGHTHGTYSLNKYGKSNLNSLYKPSVTEGGRWTYPDFADNLDMGNYPSFIATPKGYTTYSTAKSNYAPVNYGQAFDYSGSLYFSSLKFF